jgi:hypothetical protein
MDKADTIATFFMKISKIRDQLGASGEIISDRDIFILTLNGLQSIGSHSFRVLVGDPNCPSLIGYGHIVLRRRPDLLPEVHKVPIMMRVMPLPCMQGKEKEND